MRIIQLYRQKCILFFKVVLGCLVLSSCQSKDANQETSELRFVKDTLFVQETHDAFKIGPDAASNEIRSISVDHKSNVWIATASGVFRKENGSGNWNPVITDDNRGPAYSVAVKEDGTVLLGTWNGLYQFSNNTLKKEEGVKPPISVVCTKGNETYALGPYGIWSLLSGKWKYQDYKIAHSVRDALTDGKGNIWVATDAGLYLCNSNQNTLYQNTNELVSAYAKAVSLGYDQNIWVGGMGGVSIRQNNTMIKKLTPKEGLSSSFVNCISQAPDGVMWVGTNVGIVRFNKDYTHSLRFSRRWLTDNQVNDIAFDKEGDAWIATAKGVSCIRRHQMTLADKERDYYTQLIKRHIRPPWTCGVLRLEVPGDTSTWRNSDDDNDGEYTGGYLAMESFRYAVTKSEDAKAKARKAFDFLRYLQEVTGTEGFFARSIVPVDWKEVNDANRTYTPQQLADELVQDPRYKPVEVRWRKSGDGKWLWKGDTSSDEMDGHLMGYFFYYEYAAGEEEKVLIRNHVKKIMDQLIKTNFNLIDVDGTHTRWSVWSPEQLNNDPDWSSEKSLNSFELLAYLKFVGHLTGDEKYEKIYRQMIDEHGYLDNASKLNSKNPAWQIYFDRTLEGYLFPILLKYENDPKLKAFYEQLADGWMKGQESGENLINNLTYALATGKKVNIPQTIEFLRDAPLDLVDWPIDHRLREDVQLVRSPIMEELQIAELPPASIRSTVRWDKNPWAAVSGDARQVKEPVFWLWPYWMSRYLEIIKE
ncbi:MAG: two-component regulator propeller domain-containing protein [Mariniphaga sp.]